MFQSPREKEVLHQRNMGMVAVRVGIVVWIFLCLAAVVYASVTGAVVLV